MRMKLARWPFCLVVLTGTVLSASPRVSPAAATRFLEQATWGPAAASVGRLQQIGFEQWLADQFATPPSDIPDASSLRQLQDRFFLNALVGEDQLRQRMAFALSEIWVVSGTKINRPEALAPYLRLLAADAFGNYYDLMRDVTLSPAMGHYLDMVNNDKPNPALGKSANENYARELMQLFTLGEALLNQDGSPQRDADGRLIPAYTEATVQDLARVFTGWTYPPAPGQPSRVHNPAYWAGPMVAFASNHDTGPKTMLNGVTLPAGQSPEADLQSTLENIFNHPNVGPFICMQLIQHLVTSNPSPGYVARVAAVFADNGAGVRGDLKAVLRAILLDPEARAGDDSISVSPLMAPGQGGGPPPDDPATPSPNDGHLREPVLFITGLLRLLNATAAVPNALAGYASQMGQNVYFAPSVFNYFSPAYNVPGTPLLGPEFQIYSSAAAIVRANFVNTVIFGSVGGIKVDLTPLVQAAQNADTLLDNLGATFLHGRMPPDMRASIVKALDSATTDSLKARTALYLVASSALYQVEH